jgi:hypothetical protein
MKYNYHVYQRITAIINQLEWIRAKHGEKFIVNVVKRRKIKTSKTKKIPRKPKPTLATVIEMIAALQKDVAGVKETLKEHTTVLQEHAEFNVTVKNYMKSQESVNHDFQDYIKSHS